MGRRRKDRELYWRDVLQRRRAFAASLDEIVRDLETLARLQRVYVREPEREAAPSPA